MVMGTTAHREPLRNIKLQKILAQNLHEKSIVVSLGKYLAA